MSETHVNEIFVERIANVAHANGVFRITLGVNEDESNVRSSVRLIIPANQLGPILQGIANSAKNIGEQIQFNAKEDGKGGTGTSRKETKAADAKSASKSNRKPAAKANPKAKK